MTVEETIRLLALIKLAYPNAYKDIDKETQKATVNMWYSCFGSVPYPIVELALNHFVKTSKFPPTIADIYEELNSLHYEALQNVLSLEAGERRNLYKKIMDCTEQYTKRNDSILGNVKVQNLLNSVNKPSLEG